LEKVSEYLSLYDSAYVHKQSFDYFINHRLAKIIEEEPTITVPLGDNKYYNIHFGQVFVDKPYIIDENRQIRYILPNEARLRDLTYSSLISVNIRTFKTEKNAADEVISETNSQDFYKISLARIPMMIGTSKCNLYNKNKEQKLKSGECEYDNGGYFIIKGKERALVSQERINYNIVHVFDQKMNSKFNMVSEIRSMSEETGHSVLIQMKLTNNLDKRILLQIPYVSQEIPLGYIFKAYNFSMEEIVHILDVNLKSEYEKYPVIYAIAKNITRDAETIGNQEKAISYITQFSMHSLSKDRRFYYIHQILNNELFPHLGITSSKNQKGFFLGHMLSKLLFTFVKKRSIDDRDHINNKRLEAAGHLVAELFRTLFKRFVRSMEPQLIKRPDILVVMSRNNVITQGIKHCFSTGNWGIPKSNYIRTGVSQILSRLTYNSFLSHLRRILIPIGKEGKNTKIRQLHPSQIGYICPFETPEGHCLTADTLILGGDGVTCCPITDFKNPELEVVTVDVTNGEEHKTKTRQYFEVRPKELYEITLINDRSIKASGLHPFLVFNSESELEWKKAKDIQMSDMLATRPILKCIDNIPALTKMRVCGLLRALYRTDKKYLIIPDFLDWDEVMMDLNACYKPLEFNKKHRKVFLAVENMDTNVLIPEWVQKKGHIRDYCMGFFCGIDIGEKIIDQNIIRDLNCVALNGDYQHKQKLWKDFFSLVAKNFDIKWESVSFDEEKIMKFFIELTDKNIINFIDTFGFYYNSESEKNMFIYRDFLTSKIKNESIEFIEYLSHIRVYNKRITFYPIQSIRRLKVEMTMDFTTVSDHHNFIANGFVTHNSAGIVKNMTLTTQLSTKLNSVFLRMVLEEIKEINMSFDFDSSILGFKGKEYYKVLMDGNWIGSSHSSKVYDVIYDYKNKGRFSPYMSVSINENEREVLIFTDEGRMVRPLWNAKKFPTIHDMKTKSIETLIKEQYIILIDSYEIENNIIAMTPDELERSNFYTLCEIHPSLITGLCVGLIPYSDHTQAPRITYHASMGKQAIGVYASTNNIRSDTIVHVLLYPERPLVQTHMGMVSGCNDMVFGMNLIVAVAMYTGFNQEDSVILNQSAIDRGMFRSFAFRTIHVEERKKSTTHTEDIMMPAIEIRAKSYNYSKLNANGIVKAGIFVGPSDVIVGRVQTKNIKTGGEEKTDTSVCIKSGEEGYVDRVYISTSPEGYKMVKVKIRSLKVPEIGDKVASRAAQKGTVGMIFRQEDMPFCSQTGMVPDIIINPLCLPSRMTINQIIECIASKSSAQEGVFRFGTPFTRHSTDVVESLCNDLAKNGFSEDGKESMTNGFTGDQFEARIFIGPTYYHRLKHLVSAKIHARNHGSLQALTRQPVEGRSRDGGLRFGEMERDTCSGDSSISLQCGLSVTLNTMTNTGWHVLGWSSKDNGIVNQKQTAFLDKGEKDCVEITLQDGKKLKCTPDHPMLTTDNVWVRAQDLIKGVSRLKVSVDYPLMNMASEIEECNNWTLQVGLLTLRTDNSNNYMQTLAFMRILGYLMTDGGLYKNGSKICGNISVGHLIDVEALMVDLKEFCDSQQTKFLKQTNMNSSYYSINIPPSFAQNIGCLPGLLFGRKVTQPAQFPDFIIDTKTPLPILREFLGAMFGGDGHTSILAMHRGKRDVLTSISFSRSRVKSQLKSLEKWMQDFIFLLGRFGITNVTIQKLKETTYSKKNYNDEENKEKVYQSTLHLDMNELIPFHDKIGFRHCCHKSQRLEAAVSYKRLRNEVTRQHNWIVDRVDKLTNFSEIKKADPTKIVGTKKAIIEAVKELKKMEPLIHEYAIPSTHDITDHLIKGTQFGKFTSKSFPNAEQYLKEVGAFEWFIDDDDADHNCYSVSRETMALPTMNLTVLDVRPCGKEKVFDIEVEEINSFLANGIVAHNCMISHGVSRFLTERLFDMSDVFSVPLCANCGAMPHASDICNVCDCTNIRRVLIPYACKLLFQELMAMGIKINLFPDEDKKYKTLPLN
jgi:DNA-directed RNA polymerase beta subunit/intein/homing endonuclease